jgi:hypothetical protein
MFPAPNEKITRREAGLRPENDQPRHTKYFLILAFIVIPILDK